MKTRNERIPKWEHGLISADCAYSLEYVKHGLGLGVYALRSARRNGLIVRRLGRSSFVMGADLIRHLKDKGKVVSSESELNK